MRIFGEIVGIPEGSEFENRYSLSQYGVHKPLQAGISGSYAEGADSIVLSGGYEDDVDYGDVILYTGHGGRSQVTGLQVADQQLTHQNLALVLNCQLALPVRVIRGYNHKSNFSPAQGYRYDGLYQVDSYWREKGLSGFFVWRFRLVKISHSSEISTVEEEQPTYGTTKRIEATSQRIVRNPALSARVKNLYNFRCQVCQIEIICPNHHVMFDYGSFGVADDLRLIGIEGKLVCKARHSIDRSFLQYHREHFLAINH